MNTALKIALSSILGIGIIGIGRWFYKLKSLSDKLEIISDVKIEKIDLNEILLNAKATLKNPTGTAIQMMFPFVKLFHGELLLGSSNVIQRIIEIPAHGEAKIEDILISLKTADLLSSANSILKDYQNGQPVELKIDIQSTLFLLKGNLKVPYQTTEIIKLNQAKTT